MNLTEQCFVSACKGIDESERQKAGRRMAPMIQFGSLALILWQAIELSIRQPWNIGAAEAAADKVCLSSQWRRNATFQQSSQSLNMSYSDVVDVATEKQKSEVHAGERWKTNAAEEASGFLHPIDECSARANHDVAFVDHMAIRNELVARAKHGGRAWGGVRTRTTLRMFAEAVTG